MHIYYNSLSINITVVKHQYTYVTSTTLYMSSPKVNLIVRVTSLNRSQFQSRFISCVKKNYLFRTIMSRMNIVIGQVMKRHKMRPELVKVRYLRLVLDKYLLKVCNLVNSFFKDILL